MWCAASGLTRCAWGNLGKSFRVSGNGRDWSISASAIACCICDSQSCTFLSLQHRPLESGCWAIPDFSQCGQRGMLQSGWDPGKLHALSRNASFCATPWDLRDWIAPIQPFSLSGNRNTPHHATQRHRGSSACLRLWRPCALNIAGMLRCVFRDCVACQPAKRGRQGLVDLREQLHPIVELSHMWTVDLVEED
jgi:hypothetical protein